MLLAVALVSVACSSGGDPGATRGRAGSSPAPAGTTVHRPVVVATTSIWGDVVRSVAGDDADVSVLMTTGDDPRTFALPADRIAGLTAADLVVTTGLGFEAGLVPALDQARAAGVAVLEAAPLVGPVDTAFGRPDPHVWMDADRLTAIARSIAARLAVLAGQPAGPGSGASDDRWSGRADAFAEQVTRADEQAQAALNPLPGDRRRAFTGSDGLGYLAERYGLTLTPPPPNADVTTFGAAVDQLGPPGSATATTPALIVDTAQRLATYLSR